MSRPDLRTDNILRQRQLDPEVRRLPGLILPEAQAATAEQSAQQSANVRESLRAAFAAELAELEEEARLRGIVAAQREASSALQSASDALTRQFQKQEAVLRNASEQERSQLMALIAAVRTRYEQLMPELEPVVTRLALIVTARLLGQRQIEGPLVAELAKHAIEEYRLAAPFQISVAAEDHAFILAHATADDLRQHLRIDHALVPGSCLIDYGSGQLDASLAIQWAALQAVVLQAASGGDHVVNA